MLDPRPLLDEAAQVAARYGNTGLLIAETITAGLAHRRQLWFGNPRNVGIRLREIAEDLGIEIKGRRLNTWRRSFADAGFAMNPRRKSRDPAAILPFHRHRGDRPAWHRLAN